VEVQVGGRPLRARVLGPAGAPPVVLVHGLGVASAYLLPLARRLARDARVLIPDLPGFGASPGPPQALDVPGLAGALSGFLDAAGLGRVPLVGQSLGCQDVVALAVREPERVDRLVLLGPTWDPAAPTLRRQAVRLALDGLREPVHLDLLQMREYLRAGSRRVLATARAMLAHPIQTELPSVNVPVLVVRGARDPIVSQAWAERITALLPHGRLVVLPGGAHLVHHTHPDDTAATVAPFLGADAPPPSLP